MARKKRVDNTDKPHSEDLREKLLAEILKHVAFDGWTDKTLNDAAASLKLDEAKARIAFPRSLIYSGACAADCA